MIVVDTSSFISLAMTDVLSLVLLEFDVHTSKTVIGELEAMAEYTDRHGTAARTVLRNQDQITIHRDSEQPIQTSRIDPGEGSCAVLTRHIDAEFLITDDLRALPELNSIVNATVAISPLLLKALVIRGELSRDEAMERLEQIARSCDWLEAPIFRRAKRLFDQD